MSKPSRTLTDAATAVAALGSCQDDIDALDDASLQAGMSLIRELDQQLQPYRLWMAAAIARRSDHTLGYSGLAQKNGFPTPATFIQSLTGTSKYEAVKLARLGEMMVEAESAAPISIDGSGIGGSGIDGSGIDASGGVTGGSGSTAITTAVTAGGITLDGADAIRRGLGIPGEGVSAEQLRIEAERLIAHAASGSAVATVTPESLLKLARRARERLDTTAIERGQQERAASRAVRVWDGGCRFPGCDKPPSWTEVNHILQWARDHGRTDIINAILLCRYHHMLIHEKDWEIVRMDGPSGGTYWLKPPEHVDPDRTLIEMPSKNPLATARQSPESASR